jgi:hypothetical protein
MSNTVHCGAGQPTLGKMLELPEFLPSEFVRLAELVSSSIERPLGYFRNERVVVFGYCPGGGEVIWRDGSSSGFAAGAWRVFLEEISPLAARRGVKLGDLTSIGTHVLLMDRLTGAVYGVPRELAEATLASVYGTPRPRRPCLCTLMNCAACPVGTCALSAAFRGEKPAAKPR